MTFDKDDLPKFLKPGMKVSISFHFGPRDQQILPATVLGLKESKFLILDLPQKVAEDLALRKLDNADVVIRGIADTDLGHAVAFKTSVLSVISKPSLMVFLRLPGNFITKPIREHERYKLNLNCTVNHQKNLYDCTLVDFSISGCGLTTLIEPEFELEDVIRLEFPLNRYLSADNTYRIVSIKKITKGWAVGVKFDKPVLLSKELRQELLEQAFQAASV